MSEEVAALGLCPKDALEVSVGYGDPAPNRGSGERLLALLTA